MKPLLLRSVQLIAIAVSIMLTGCTRAAWSPVGRRINIITAGLSGPVYATDAEFDLKRVRAGKDHFLPNDTTFRLAGGLKYRIVDTKAGVVYIKMIPSLGYSRNSTSTGPMLVQAKDTAATDGKAQPPTPSASAATALTRLTTGTKVVPGAGIISVVDKYKTGDVDVEPHTLFAVAEADIQPYNKIMVSQVALGVMILPIKIRPATTFNGVRYERHFATDVSVGPFIGYRFKLKRNNYNSHTTVAAFAGPTMIDFVSTISQSGAPPTSVNPDNIFGFTSGVGIVHETQGFQIGFIYGGDRVSGRRVIEWPYDGKNWFSLAIGYNFLQNK